MNSKASTHNLIAGALQPAAADPGSDRRLDDLEQELARVRIQRQRLDERERVLLAALSEAGEARLAELSAGLLANGVVLQDALRATLATSSRKPAIDASKLAQSFVRKAPIKFRHPDQPAWVWSGRGKTPAWVRELEHAGRLDEARLIVGDEDSGGETA